MMKRLLFSLACIALALQLTGCSSSSSSDEGSGGDETFAEEGAGDFQEDEGGDLSAEGDESGGDTAATDSGADSEGDDLSLEDEGQDASQSASNSAEDDLGDLDDSGDDLSLDDETQDQPVAQEGPADTPTDTPPASGETPADPVAETPPVDAFAETPPATEPVAETPVSEPATAPVPSTVSAPAVFYPVTKIKTSPFTAGEANLNRVYIGRPGDSAKSIAKRIYGDESRAKDLRKWNSSLSNGVTVGEKVYYQSPTSAADTNMLTYYEDIGVAPQVYVTKSGDNIRAVSKDLLGHRDSWKEVWATNFDVESKANVPEGLNLRYWPDQPVPQMVAQTPTQPQEIPPLTQTDPTLAPVDQPTSTGGNFQPVDTPPMAQPTPDQAVASNPSPTQPPTAPPSNDPFAMPTPDPMLAQGTPPAPPADPTVNPTVDPAQVATIEPTPDPNTPVNPDPSQPQPPTDTPAVSQVSDDADSMMMIGMAGIVILAGAAVFLIMKKRKPKSVDLTQTTQVG